METKLSTLLVVTSLVIFLTTVSAKHHQHKKHPHMCHADGESSEECKANEWRRKNLPIIYYVDVATLKVQFYLHKNTSSTNAEWKILIPGFPSNGKSPFPNNVRDAYLQRMINFPTERYNIIVVDWERDSMCKMDTLVENTNFTYTEVVGERVAEMLVFLHEEGFLTLSKNAHIIGFSMGAHVAGEAARCVFRKFFKKNLIYRISALDPASEIFWPTGRVSSYRSPQPMNRVPRIRRSFVGYLDAYHTSNKYGIEKKIGDIDFFVNGESGQPACMFGFFDSLEEAMSRNVTTGIWIDDFTALCSHVYATELFAKSINDKSTKGCAGCDYVDLWKKGNCKCEDEPVLGEFVDENTIDGYPSAIGKAFVKTKDVRQFRNHFRQTLLDAGLPNNKQKGWNQLC